MQGSDQRGLIKIEDKGIALGIGSSSSDQESDYSLAEIRKTEKRIHKKKITKIIHNCLVLDRRGNQVKVVRIQQTSTESCIKDPVNLKNYVKRKAQSHNRSVIPQKQKMNITLPRTMTEPVVPQMSTFAPYYPGMPMNQLLGWPY